MLTKASIDGPVLAISYIRVSTMRQAEDGMSLDKQRREIATEAARLGYKIVAEYIDACGSGLSDRRPEFQQMIAECCSKDSSVKAVFVYDFSRFSRDTVAFESYRRKLEKAGVELHSSTAKIVKAAYGK